MEATTSLRSHLGVSASVCINQKPVALYKAKTTPAKLSAYIESSSEKEFTVTFTDSRAARTPLGAVLVLDGVECEAYCLDPEAVNKGPVATFIGKRESPSSIRPYKFSKVSLTDDPNLAISDEKILRGIGTIQVKVCRVRVVGSTSSFNSSVYREEGSKILNEQTKKAQISHSTGLGHAKYSVPPMATKVEWIDTTQRPLLVFEFIYRSRTLLELQGIIPYEPKMYAKESETPSPIPTPPRQKRKEEPTEVITIDSNSDDSDEDEDPKAELRRLRSELARLKNLQQVEPSRKKVKPDPDAIILDDD
ncbi:hypothetical protein T439DRAFT_320822 [Meredithblackwellia eburnea MCA 4105]